MSKLKLRKHFAAITRHIKPEYRENASFSAAKHFAAMEAFASSTNIASYLPFRYEFDSAPLIETVWRAQKECYLPVLTEEKSLIFVRYCSGDPLRKNQYGIFEPKIISTDKVLAAEHLDLVIAPLLAFDSLGTRLGTGGGYYDRTFAFLNVERKQGEDKKRGENKENDKKPLIIGLAFKQQGSPEPLPKDVWDIRLDAVVTEEGVVNFAIKKD